MGQIGDQKADGVSEEAARRFAMQAAQGGRPEVVEQLQMSARRAVEVFAGAVPQKAAVTEKTTVSWALRLKTPPQGAVSLLVRLLPT